MIRTIGVRLLHTFLGRVFSKLASFFSKSRLLFLNTMDVRLTSIERHYSISDDDRYEILLQITNNSEKPTSLNGATILEDGTSINAEICYQHEGEPKKMMVKHFVPVRLEAYDSKSVKIIAPSYKKSEAQLKLTLHFVCRKEKELLIKRSQILFNDPPEEKLWPNLRERVSGTSSHRNCLHW